MTLQVALKNQDGTAAVVQEGLNKTGPNPYIILTDAGQYRMVCSNPYSQSSNDEVDAAGTLVAFVMTGIFATCLCFFLAARLHVKRMYRQDRLAELGSCFVDDMPAHGAAAGPSV